MPCPNVCFPISKAVHKYYFQEDSDSKLSLKILCKPILFWMEVEFFYGNNSDPIILRVSNIKTDSSNPCSDASCITLTTTNMFILNGEILFREESK